ncbi:hypothetical protein [Paractinoplanes brasiliensis]|nr:hypothetical protein [Actinoplanes brasiliensis]
MLIGLTGCSDSSSEPGAAPATSTFDDDLDRGDCLARTEGWHKVACDDPAATVEVLTAYWAGNAVAGATADVDCPDGTDNAFQTSDMSGQYRGTTAFTHVCVRNLKPPHPGDPGGGGGPGLVVGDCVRVVNQQFAGEARCDGKGETKPTHKVARLTKPLCGPGHDGELVIKSRNLGAQDPLDREVACINAL